MPPVIYLAFVDDENIVHLLNMADCHITNNRGSQAVEVKGRGYHMKKGVGYIIGDINGVLQHYNQMVSLISTSPPEA